MALTCHRGIWNDYFVDGRNYGSHIGMETRCGLTPGSGKRLIREASRQRIVPGIGTAWSFWVDRSRHRTGVRHRACPDKGGIVKPADKIFRTSPSQARKERRAWLPAAKPEALRLPYVRHSPCVQFPTARPPAPGAWRGNSPLRSNLPMWQRNSTCCRRPPCRRCRRCSRLPWG
jgi:hypothetical protein